MQDFKEHLLKKEYSNSTIDETIRNLNEFLTYCKILDIQEEQVNFQSVLAFIETLQKRKLKPQTINNKLSNIKKYYEYLKQYGYIKTNPIDRIKQKGVQQKIITNALSTEQLQGIYNSYAKEKNYREKKLAFIHQRNTVLLGLMIYQGLHSGELKTMHLQDIDMNTATLFIRGSKRSNERYIKLQAGQMVHIYKYLSTLPSEQQQLFKANLNNVVFYIISELKGVFTQLQNAGHIRASVILNWLKLYGKRQTQYLIGHRYISSTEKYQQQDLQLLSDLMKSFHPFG